MAKRLQLRRGITTESNAFKGAVGEVTVDTNKNVLVVHDGVTVGGLPVAARANTDGTISLIKKDGAVITTIPTTGLFNNTLTSTATDQALTAAQGKVLKDLSDAKLTTTSAFGVGQSMQDVTSSRVKNTTYTNSTSKTIFLIVEASTGNGNHLGISVNGATVISNSVSSGSTAICAPIPSGATYSISDVSGTGSSIQRAFELR